MSIEKYSRILIDVPEMYYGIISEANPENTEGTVAVFNFFKLLSGIETEYLEDGGKLYLLFSDDPSKSWIKKNIDPDYKVNRQLRSPQFARGLDYLRLMLSHYKTGYRLITCPEVEASDLVPVVVDSLKESRLLVVSSSIKCACRVNENIHWLFYKESGTIIYDKNSFFNKYGFHPSEHAICLYESFFGPYGGVEGMPVDIVLNIIKKVKSVSDIFINLNELEIPESWKVLIKQNRGKLLLNSRIVCYKPVSIEKCRGNTLISEFNYSILLMFYKALKFIPGEVDSRFID